MTGVSAKAAKHKALHSVAPAAAPAGKTKKKAGAAASSSSSSSSFAAAAAASSASSKKQGSASAAKPSASSSSASASASRASGVPVKSASRVPSTAAAAASFVDDVFGKKDELKKANEEKRDRERAQLEALRAARDEERKRAAGRKRTEEGYPVFSAEELNIGRGGDTDLCPFDCDCCY